MKLSGPLVDSFVHEAHQVLIATKEFLSARTAESRINAMHTERDRDFLMSQIRKKDNYIAQLQSKLDTKGDDRTQGRGRGKRPERQNYPEVDNDAPLTHKIPGLEGLKAKMADGEQQAPDAAE